MTGSSPTPRPTPNAVFAPTRWTLVQRARGATPEARAALSELCEAYWQPVFRFLRREGRDEDTARELTQGFFAHLLGRGDIDAADPARGRFRTYLLGAVKHYLADLRRREGRLKRGGGDLGESLDAGTDTSPGLQLPDHSAVVPDSYFDREWALAVMARALSALQAEYAGAVNPEQFDVLKPWLVGETEALSQGDAARRLGMTEGALKVAVHRFRRRFRELVRRDIAQTVGDVPAVAEELRYLVEVLRSGFGDRRSEIEDRK